MHHYLEFMEECERLKDLFLLEGEDDKKKDTDASDDLADLGGGDDEETPEENTEESEENPEENPTEDGESDDIDLDLDGDLGEVTGDESLEPEAEDVNAEEKPGAVNPATLYKELTQGDDTIYDRTAKAALEKFPNGKCEVKDMLPIIAIGIKSYMKNKNYAPIPKIDMKKLVFRIAHDIHDRLSKKKKTPDTATEAIFYRKDELPLMEGWKELMLAGAIAGAPVAGHAATAESAPLSTHSGTSKIITNNANPDVDSTSTMHTKGKAYHAGSQVDSIPISPDQAAKVQLTDEGGSTTQAAAKGQVKANAGKTAKSAKSAPAKATSADRCSTSSSQCSCQKPHEEDIDFEELAHKAGHKAVDVGIKGAKTVWGGLKGAASGLWNGAKDSWNAADKKMEHDHDKMIQERGK